MTDEIKKGLTFKEESLLVFQGEERDPQQRNGSIDIVSLYDLMSVVIENYQTTMKIPEQYRAKFYQQYPMTDDGKFDTKYNVITANLRERLRGNTGRQGNDRRPLKHTFERQFEDKNNQGHGIVVESKWMDNWFDFEVISSSKNNADVIALWFENMMDMQRHILKLAGIQEFFFERREKDRKEEILGVELYIRNLIYFLRTEESYYYHTKTIESILVQFGIAPRTKEIFIDGKTYRISGK